MSDINPYAPPVSPDLQPVGAPKGVVTDGAGRFVMAGLLARFGGALADGLFAMAVLFALGLLFGLLQHGELLKPDELRLRSPDIAKLLNVVSPLVTTALQGVLIQRRGQSLGKILVRTRIVLADGTVAGAYHGLVIRTLPMVLVQVLLTALAITQLNSLVGFLFMIDPLFVLGEQRRCLHDRWAGTFVAKAR